MPCSDLEEIWQWRWGTKRDGYMHVLSCYAPTIAASIWKIRTIILQLQPARSYLTNSIAGLWWWVISITRWKWQYGTLWKRFLQLRWGESEWVHEYMSKERQHQEWEWVSEWREGTPGIESEWDSYIFLQPYSHVVPVLQIEWISIKVGNYVVWGSALHWH